jgi:hypothetical protein
MAIKFSQIDDETNGNNIAIQPKMLVSSYTGFSICMRVLFKSWNENWLVYSNHTKVRLSNIKIGQGFFRHLKHFIFFNWTQVMPVSVNNWNSMCFAYNVIKCSIMITINGFNVSTTNVQQMECVLGNLSNHEIRLGDQDFSGQITDFNLWNRPLTSGEMKEFCTSCTNDFVRNSKPELIYWPDANITSWGNSTEKWTIEEGFEILCKEDKLLSRDRYIILPNNYNYESARKKCNSLNGELILPEEENLDQIQLKIRYLKFNNSTFRKMWVPIIKVNEMDSMWVHETSNGTLLNVTLPGLYHGYSGNEFKCIYFDLQSRQYHSTDCYQPDFPYFAVCQISPDRLIFKVVSKSNVQWFLDDEYFLTNRIDRMNQLAMFGIQGKTMILMQERQWVIYDQMVKNDSLVGILNGTPMYPNGLQTISYTERNNVDASIQLKLSNV